MDMESVHSVGSKDSGRKQTYDHGDQTGYPDDVKYEGGYLEDLTLDVDRPENPALGPAFKGMGKEELLKHSSKPFWRRLRMACVTVIIVAWLALLITVVALVLVYPKCRTADGRSWWQKEVIYRIYVRSFFDSDGNGIGDLQGVKSKLPYIKDLGINVISLSPIYEDDDVDADFNIMDQKMIDTDYGNVNDFRDLVDAVHDLEMYLLLDFIPNHTSDQHPWFVQSSNSSDRSNDFRNYYVWTGSTTNWRTVYSNSSWSPSSLRNEKYLHQFLASQPDLNLRSTQVQDSLEDIFRHWLNFGVDGFYIRNSGFLFEDFDMRNELPNAHNDNNNTADEYSYYDHEFTYGLPEVYDMLARWRTMAEEHYNVTEKLLLADTTGSLSMAMNLYGHFDRDGVQLSLNRHFLSKEGACDSQCINTYVNQWMSRLPKHSWANWMIGDDLSKRAASRFNTSFIRAFTMMTFLLPGTPVLYYGDEILMEDDTVGVELEPWKRRQTMRGLMQWDNSTNGGFQECKQSTCSSPWIPSDGGYTIRNVEDQVTDADSMLNLVKNLTTLRGEETFIIGEYTPVIVDENIFSFVREFDGKKGYLAAINFGDVEQQRNYHSYHTRIQSSATVVLTTHSSMTYKVDDTVKTTSITLGPFQGVVVVWDYVAKEL